MGRVVLRRPDRMRTDEHALQFCVDVLRIGNFVLVAPIVLQLLSSGLPVGGKSATTLHCLHIASIRPRIFDSSLGLQVLCTILTSLIA